MDSFNLVVCGLALIGLGISVYLLQKGEAKAGVKVGRSPGEGRPARWFACWGSTAICRRSRP